VVFTDLGNDIARLNKLAGHNLSIFILINSYIYMGSVFSMAGYNKYLAMPEPV